jgi:hypothetical protein
MNYRFSHHLKRGRYIAIAVIFVVQLLAMTTHTVSADICSGDPSTFQTADGQVLSDCQKQVLRMGIGYFDVKAELECTDSATISASGLPQDIVGRIEKLQPEYEKASKATGVPWQLLAAIHYREANNSPTQDLQAGNPIGGPYAQSSTDYIKYGHPDSIEQSAEIAAKHLIASATGGIVKKPINTSSPDSEAIKDVLFSYNGRASAYAQQAASLGFDPVKQPYEGSPYVMNNFDSVHKDMKIITIDHGAPDAVDSRFGAFTVYARLGGASISNDACGTQGANGAVLGNVVQTAINYAWPDYHEPNYFEMKPAYKAAIDKAIKNNEYVGGLNHPGIDCGGFVTRVMRDSGADPSYNSANGNTDAQFSYLNAHPEKYLKLGTLKSTKSLQPGDIAINHGHTYIYVGDQPNFHGNAASASVSFSGFSWRAPMASTTYFSDSNGSFTWFRLK